METPPWALEIVKEICAEYDRSLPAVRIRQGRKHPLSTGSMYRKSNRIVVTFGTAGHDHKQVLLHELAHLVNPKGRHGKEFYTILRSLLIKYDCWTQEYKEREYKHHKISLKYL